MTHHQSTGRTIANDFADFNKKHPFVYEMFKTFAKNIIGRKTGKRTGGRLIIERIRWEVAMKIERSNDDFKINNNFTPHYVRKFIKDFPQFENCFERRRLRA